MMNHINKIYGFRLLNIMTDEQEKTGKEVVSAEEALVTLIKQIEHPKKKNYLEALLRFGKIKETVEASGISRTTVWLWRRDDEDFSKAFDEIREIKRLERLEEYELELGKRALDRTAPMTSVLLMFLLKAEDPGKYREKIDAGVNIGEVKVILAMPKRQYPQLNTPDGAIPPPEQLTEGKKE